MSSVYKYKNITFFSNHTTILLCGLFILFLFTAVFVDKEIGFAKDGSEEINLEENNTRIKQVRKEIKEIQDKINNYEAEVKAQQKKERTLKSEILIYTNKINKNELEIKETKLLIEKSEIEMEEIKQKIEEGERRVEDNRDNLKNLIKILYIYEQDSILEILITKEDISDFFNEVSAIDSIKDKIFTKIIDLKQEKNDLNSRIKELEEQQDEKGKLIQIKEEQSKFLTKLKIQKNELLNVTKGEEKRFQQLLDENKNILPSLKAQLHDLQSLGQKIEFDDAFSAARHIGSIAGVRPAYLLGILKVESNLGLNTGSGTWENDMYGCYIRLSQIARTQKRKNYYIRRANTEKDAFFSIVNRLNLDPNSVKVSREPTYGCGGAMGPAQFIPSTWIAYEERISAISGHYPPNPWDLVDAIAAMAVKVSDIPGVVGGDYNGEYEAAGRYLGGRNWRKKNLFFYPNQVMLYADLYEKELEQ